MFEYHLRAVHRVCPVQLGAAHHSVLQWFSESNYELLIM